VNVLDALEERQAGRVEVMPTSRATGGELGTSGEDEPLASAAELSFPARSAPDSLPPAIASALTDLVPRPHGTIRKLRLAPPTAVVGASTTFVVDTGSTAARRGADIEPPSLDQSTPLETSVARASPTPIVQPLANDDQANSATYFGSGESADSDSAVTDSAEVRSAESAAKSSRAGAPPASQGGGAPAAVGQAPKSCSGGGTGVGQSGAAASSRFATPPGPPCTPPGRQDSSVADPLFVLNYRDGLVMFPGVVEFDTVGESVDLRAQVYGATVQAYSWNLSQAPRAGCVSGTTSYKLQFQWTGYSPAETTERITITATMTDQNDDARLFGFRIVHVFDVAQTEGDELPDISKPTGDPHDRIRLLEQVVRDRGIELEYVPIPDGADGMSLNGKIVIASDLEPVRRFGVLAHELAHELLHHRNPEQKTSRIVRETEAEAVAYVVCQAFGIDSTGHSSDYIQLYSGDSDTLAESLQLVQATAANIISEMSKAEASHCARLAQLAA
jgi:hypothetical protein